MAAIDEEVAKLGEVVRSAKPDAEF